MENQKTPQKNGSIQNFLCEKLKMTEKNDKNLQKK
jgi:hypothetical protein